MKAIARAKTWHRVLAASVALTAVCGFSETPDYFVEWGQPSAALHVDTGVRGKVGVKAEVQFIHRSSPTFPVLLGSWGGNKKRFNLVMHWNEQGRWEYGDQMNNLGGFPWYGLLTTVSVEVPANGAMSCTWTNTEGGSMNHTMNATATYGLLDTETTLTLFASHYKDASSESFNQPHLGRLYYCKLWEGDTGAWTLSRDFRPCVKDGVAGLYDSVEGVIHYPAGNVLVAGPVAYDTIATWNGGTTPTAAELATASNWTCTDKNGDSVASAVPDKATLVVFPAGIGSVTLPDGYIAPWGAVRADGSVAHPATQYGTYTKGRDFVIIPACGYGTSDTKGYFTQDGGTVEIGGAATIGRTGIGHYTMTGGRLHATGNFYVGHSWSGNNAGDGLFSISGDAVAELDKGIILGNNRIPGTLALSGGTLFTPSIKKGSNTATVTFDGGTVVATNVTDGANFITGLNNVTYGPGGLTLDTAAYDVTMATASGANVTAAAGSTFTKTGSGTLTVAAVPPVGNMVVSNGTLALSASCDNAAMLAHRWSFTSDLPDSVTGTAGGATASAGVTYSDGKASLTGGNKGTCYINLGANKLPSDSVTLEFWTTITTRKVWTKMFCLGKDSGNCLAFTLKPNASGGTEIKGYCYNATTGALVGSLTQTIANWSLIDKIIQQSFCLGYSFWNDPDAYADYAEVRVWSGALSADAIALSATKGPDATAADIAEIVAVSPADRNLTVASGATLSIGAGNTLTQPVVKGSGTVAGGTLVVSYKMLVTCGETLTASGTIDLTNAKVELVDPENLTTGFYFIKPAPNATLSIVGKPEAVNLSNGWQISVSSSGAKLQKVGFTVLLR